MDTIIVGVIVLGAVVYLGRMFYKRFIVGSRDSEAGCPSCGSCDSSAIGPADSRVQPEHHEKAGHPN